MEKSNLVDFSDTYHTVYADKLVKVLDHRELKYDALYESPKLSQVLLDFPILAQIIEERMLSRYHLTPMTRIGLETRLISSRRVV